MTALKTGTAKLALAIARKSQSDIAQAFALNGSLGIYGAPNLVIAPDNGGGVTLEFPAAHGPVAVGFLQLLEQGVWQAFVYRHNVIPAPMTPRSKEALVTGCADSLLGAVYLIIGTLHVLANSSA